MEKYWEGIPKKLRNITKLAICFPFEVNSGLKQGDAISPVLFNIALNKVIRTAKLNVELYNHNGPRLLLAFADDTDVVGNTRY